MERVGGGAAKNRERQGGTTAFMGPVTWECLLQCFGGAAQKWVFQGKYSKVEGEREGKGVGIQGEEERKRGQCLKTHEKCPLLRLWSQRIRSWV